MNDSDDISNEADPRERERENALLRAVIIDKASTIAELRATIAEQEQRIKGMERLLLHAWDGAGMDYRKFEALPRPKLIHKNIRLRVENLELKKVIKQCENQILQLAYPIVK